MQVYQKHVGDDEKLLIKFHWPKVSLHENHHAETMKRAEASSCFAVEILYKGIFGHVITFWIFTYVKIVLILTAASNPIALVCFILKVNLCENL